MTISPLPWYVLYGTPSDDKRLSPPQAAMLDVRGQIVALFPDFNNADFVLQQLDKCKELQESIDKLEDAIELAENKLNAYRNQPKGI